MKFQRKQILIEAEQFNPNIKPWPLNVVETPDGKGYRLYKPSSGSYLAIQPGYWVRTDIPDETYPIEPTYFNLTYELVK